jgi:hypothetical protein
LSVFAALRHPVPAEFVNVNRWHSHIAALVGPRCVILFAVVSSCLIISWLLLLSDALSPGKGEATCGEICRGAIEEEVAVGKLDCKRPRCHVLGIARFSFHGLLLNKMWPWDFCQLLWCRCRSSYWEWSYFCSY